MRSEHSAQAATVPCTERQFVVCADPPAAGSALGRCPASRIGAARQRIDMGGVTLEAILAKAMDALRRQQEAP